MKKHEIIFSIVKVPLDFVSVFLSFYVAKLLRDTDLISRSLNLPSQSISTNDLLMFALFGAVTYLCVFSIHGLYNTKITQSKIKEIFSIIRYSFYSTIFFALALYLGNGIIYDTSLPRLMILYTFLISSLLICLSRVIINIVYSISLRKKIIPKNKLLLINNSKVSDIKEIIEDIKNAGIYDILGYANKNKITNKLKYLGEVEDIEKLFEKNKCDEVLYINSDFNKKEKNKIWVLSRIYGIRYRYVTNSFDITKSNSELSLINKIPVIEIEATSLSAWGRVWKRIFDFIVGVIGIIIFSPILIVVSILIKLEDPKGPVIYKNLRIGQNGDKFMVYKFRYLKWKHCIKDAYGEKDKKAMDLEKKLIKNSSTRKGPLYKIKNDPRKTKIGNFIERTSIDELPQFFNLILGNMSLVGPRPHQPKEVEKYEKRHKRLLTIKPGITGMAQVNGRDKNSFEKEAELDIFYIENWSMILDIKIILKTFSVIFKR